MQEVVHYFLVEKAYLVVGLVVDQLPQRVFYVGVALYVGFDGVYDAVVGNAALHNVKFFGAAVPPGCRQ